MKSPIVLILLFSSSLCFGQDIVITSVTGNKTFEQYAGITVNATIKNEGIVATPAFFVLGALSTDNVLDNQDHHLYNDYISLAPGESKTIELKNFSNPGFLIGNYNLIIKADEYNGVQETNEANNISITSGYSMISGNVDLVFQSCTLNEPTTSRFGVINAQYTVVNTGTTLLSPRVWTTFYLSTDGILSGDDTKLKHWASIPVLNQFAANLSMPIPGVAPGNYYILGVTDNFFTDEHIDETDETNNIIAVPLTITVSDIDLEVTQFSNLYSQDGQLTFDMTIRNNGTTPVFIDEDDITLLADGMTLSGYFNITGKTIEPGQSSLFYHVTMYGYGYAWSVKEFILYVNQSHAITEVNYDNNRLVLGGIPPQKYPIVKVTAASWTGAYTQLDTELHVNATLTNVGDTYYVIKPVQFRITNSQNQIVHTDFAYFSDSYFENGTTRSAQFTLTLANTLPAGTYNLTMGIDNSITLPLTIHLPDLLLSGTIKDDSGTPITKGKLFLYQKRDNGEVRFVEQVENSTTNEFNFGLDQRNYTLYFIPDRTAFPDHLPTVFGKTLMLEPSSFFHIRQDSTVLMEVLKITPPAEGSGVISGRITEGNPGGRITSIASVTVILLNATGEPVGITTTDETGYFIFKNLAPAQYQLAVTSDPDQPITLEPYPVDISTANASVELTFSEGGISGNTERILYEQSISFHDIDEKTFGDNPFDIEATSSSGLPITYISSNTNIAVINGTKVSILRAGSVSITATQTGNGSYQAVDASQPLIIHKATQTITFEAIADKSKDEKSFELNASATSGLDVGYISNNTNVILITGTTALIVGPGEVTITASQAGNENYEAAQAVGYTFKVNLVMGTENPASVVKIYPNPSGDAIRIDSDNIISAVSLIDSSGKEEEIGIQGNEISIRHLSAGVYILMFRDGGVLQRLKVIKK
jgi:hypothetical protein